MLDSQKVLRSSYDQLKESHDQFLALHLKELVSPPNATTIASATNSCCEHANLEIGRAHV